MSKHSFKKGDRVKVYNGGKLEGWAIIIDHASTSNDYHVRFEEDSDNSIWRRTVMPAWQAEGFEPMREGGS